MRSLLNKIFSRRIGIGKFFLSAIAFLLGFSLVLLSVHFYAKINEFLSPKNQSSDYIILNKEVGLGNTIFGSKAEFTEEDIADLKKQNFVEELGVFTSNQFEVRVHVQGIFSTEAFLESVPENFIDEKPFNFRWNESSEVLPIIIHQDFLNQYNFGFALSRGAPQLSKSTIGMVPLKIELDGPGGRKTFDGKVVGFSERISSVIVPEEFLNWANKTVGSAKTASVPRVIIKVKSDQAGAIEQYFSDHGLKVSEDKFKFSKIYTIINIVMRIILVIGIAFIIFSLVIVILNFALIVADAKEEINLLIQLGYKTRYIFKHLSFYFIVFIISVSILTGAIFFFGKNFLTSFFVDNGISIDEAIGLEVMTVAGSFILLSILISLLSISRVIKNHSRI
ncbi:MAG: hypothetical protein K2X86_03080 [Cytophagaceae bacterium]|nr:hypothetical protein [Cytophagaceae bacterium]